MHGLRNNLLFCTEKTFKLKSMNTLQILNEAQIEKMVKRMAYAIYEQNFEEEKILLVGIQDTGYTLAQRLLKALEEISPLRMRLATLSLDKREPVQAETRLNLPPEALDDAVVILVDDVLNTGRTLAYSLTPFLKRPVRRLQVAVLVDRSHRNFPVSADYVGYELSTTLQEHIRVELGGTGDAVYLE